MPTVAECAESTSAFVYRIDDPEWSLQPQGSEGRQLHRKAGEAFQHWGERAEILIAGCLHDLGHYPIMQEDDDELFKNTAVPPKRTFYVKTRYVFLGRGEPLPMVLEEDD